jgi:TfoX/Sxy family transcriptional regulator of competence genes
VSPTSYDEKLAARIRRLLATRSDVEEKKMFGGVAFMVRGHMCCGIVGAKLMVRVDPASSERLLREAGARPMDFTGRPMRGFLYVEPEALASAPALRKWVARALAFVESRPPKAPLGRSKTRAARSVR